MSLRRIAQRIRHLPGIEQLEGLWSLIRKPYHRILNAGGRGVKVMVGNIAPVSIPAEFTGMDWEKHETETVAAFEHWVRQHSDSLVLDIGSSLGIFSAVALFAGERCNVVAFDSDLSSVAATRRMCQHASGDRLRVIHGFLSDKDSVDLDVLNAVAKTKESIERSKVTGDAGTTRYTCLNESNVSSIPIFTLDSLFMASEFRTSPMLIKCDVEGAELLVLQGARRLLGKSKPGLLISVHPEALPDYGHSKEDMQTFLQKYNYSARLLAVDHEEHWWCEHSR